MAGTLAADEIATLLRAVSVAELFAAYERGPNELLLELPQVFADGVVLPTGAALEHLGREGVWNSVPVIAGTTRDESKLFMILDPKYTRRRLWILPAVNDADLYLASADAASRGWKLRAVDAPISAMRRVRPNAFAYRFDWDEESRSFGFDYGAYLGAAHGIELPFVFGTWTFGRIGWLIFNDDNAAAREKLALQMRSYWVEFAYSGAPGRGRKGDQPEWLEWREAEGAPKYLVLDTDQGGGVRMESEALDLAAILAGVANDPRLTTAKAKCWVYYEVLRLEPKLYSEVESSLCAAFPAENFPWN